MGRHVSLQTDRPLSSTKEVDRKKRSQTGAQADEYARMKHEDRQTDGQAIGRKIIREAGRQASEQ